MRRVGALCLILLLASLSCSDPDPLRGERVRILGWDAIRDHGWPPNARYVVNLYGYDEQSNTGAIAFVDASGSLSVLPIDGTEVGRLDSSSGQLCVGAADALYRITRTTAERFEYDKRMPGIGHHVWSLRDGTCVAIYNSGIQEGGYVTDVVWNSEGQLLHAVVPDVPGSTGVSPGSVWVRNTGSSTLGGEVTLYRLDMRTHDVEVAARWPTGELPPGGEAVAVGSSEASDLFDHEGKLYYLEDLTGIDSEGGRAELAPGYNGELRLAGIDEATGQVSSALLERTRWAWGVDEHRHDARTSVALRDGVFFRGGIYAGDSSGMLVRVDVSRRTIGRVGSLSAFMQEPRELYASGFRDGIAFLVKNSSGDWRIETISLPSGRRTSSRLVPDLAQLTGQYEVTQWGVLEQ